MRFNLYPLDTQTCIFRFGSFAYHNDQMTYKTNKLILNHKGRAESAVSDYSVSISDLPDVYKLYLWEEGLNIAYSIAGFELKLTRHSMKYFFNYYLPSGLFTVVSWVRDKKLFKLLSITTGTQSAIPAGLMECLRGPFNANSVEYQTIIHKFESKAIVYELFYKKTYLFTIFIQFL